MIEPGWRELNEIKSLAIDWYKDEEDDIILRARFILTYMDDWLQKKAREVSNEPPAKVTSSLEPLHSDTSFSPIGGSTSFSERKEGSPPRLQATAPRTRSQSKSKALK